MLREDQPSIICGHGGWRDQSYLEDNEDVAFEVKMTFRMILKTSWYLNRVFDFDTR